MVIDSLVDLPPFFKTSLPVKVVGFKVYVNGKEYTDGKNIKKEEFYRLAESTDDLRTSYPPPEETLTLYRELEEQGVDEILAVHLPAKVSGFLSSLNQVLDKVKAKVKVFDSKSLSAGAGFVAAKLIELFEKGASFRDLEERFWDIRRRLHLQFGVPSLKFLIKNGRIGKARGMIGTLLNILPVLTVDEDGEVAPMSKVRGERKLFDKMVQNVLNFVKDREKIEMIVGWGAESARKNAMKLKEMIFGEIGDKIVNYGEIRISPTVGCHAGPGVFGIAVYAL